MSFQIVSDPLRVAAETRLRRDRRWRIVRRTVVALVLLAVVLVAAGLYYLYRIPLPNPHPRLQATLVYGANGQQIATFSEENRVDVTLAQVPQIVVDAVVSTEDRHFFSEGALNPASLARAFFADLTGSGSLQGGSTITQQYVKSAYLNPKRTLIRKIKEAAIAFRLAHHDSKKEILQNYLNTIYWGRGAYGVEAASRAYFGKDVRLLGLKEASLLAGLIREPETADPAHNPTLARTHQMDTLKALVRDKKISQAQAAAVEATPFSRYVVARQSANGLPGASGEAYFLVAVRQELYAKYGPAMVDGGGLRVTTTLNPALQAQAYSAIYGHGSSALDPAHGDPSAALVSIDDSGGVSALVGGQNFAKSSVDLALGSAGGGSGRQAGSTFKAFMLAEVVKEGYSVRSVLPAPPKVVVAKGNANGTPWVVTNYEHENVPPALNLIDATALSVNTVYAQLVARIGAAHLDAMAEALGIKPAELPHPYPSQVLGSADVSPLEMAAAYAAFADGGVYHAPVLITRVTKSDGTSVGLPVTPRSRRVLSPDQAAVVDYVLQQVVARGTGVAAGNVGAPVAGKTGTTENASDAWFIGYTPKLTTAVWMGYATSAKSMDGFRGISNVAGGTLPAQLWHAYMAAVLAAFPQYGAPFPTVTTLGGKPLNPPAKPRPKPARPGGPVPSKPPSPSSSTAPTTTLRPRPRPSVPPRTTTTRPARPTTVPPTTAASTTTTSTTTPAAGADHPELP
jgi:penicillin-binding protein 1A